MKKLFLILLLVPMYSYAAPALEGVKIRYDQNLKDWVILGSTAGVIGITGDRYMGKIFFAEPLSSNSVVTTGLNDHTGPTDQIATYHEERRPKELGFVMLSEASIREAFSIMVLRVD